MKAHSLTIQRIYSEPSLSGWKVGKAVFSPDEKFLAYLASPPESSKKMDLWVYDIEEGKNSLFIDVSQICSISPGEIPEEEKARRETSYRQCWNCRFRMEPSIGLCSVEFERQVAPRSIVKKTQRHNGD